MSILSLALRMMGLALAGLVLIAGSWFSMPPVQSEATPTPRYAPTATPFTQGGNGRNLFYVNCLACHGDRGQGLTDEFRMAQYPPDDVDCWKSGCHGNRPYDGGFTLPKTVPALIGPDALKRFDTAANLYDYIRVAMPFDRPGALTSTEYMQLAVFLLEENNIVPVGTHLDPDSAAAVLLGDAASASEVPPGSKQDGGASVALLAVACAIVGVSGIALISRRRAN